MARGRGTERGCRRTEREEEREEVRKPGTQQRVEKGGRVGVASSFLYIVAGT